MGKNRMLADKLFDQKRYYEAVSEYEGNSLNPEQMERLAICYAKTNQFSKATKLSSELIENYRLQDQELEIIAMYLVHFEYCPELTSPYLLTYTETAVRNKIWNWVIDMIKQHISEHLEEPVKVVEFLKSIKKEAKVGDYIIDLIDNLVSKYEVSLGSNGQLLKDDSAQSEFSLPEFFESIGSYENAANAYIKIGKWAAKVNKPNLIRKSMEALERLGYQDSLDYTDLKDNLAQAGPVFNPQEIIKSLPEKTDDIPMEVPEHHLKLALLLNIRRLMEQTKKEFLNSVIATPILDQQGYVEKLYLKLKILDADLAQEVMNYIASAGQFSYELQETIKNLSHPQQGLDRFVKSEQFDQSNIQPQPESSEQQNIYNLDSLLEQESPPAMKPPENTGDNPIEFSQEELTFPEDLNNEPPAEEILPLEPDQDSELEEKIDNEPEPQDIFSLDQEISSQEITPPALKAESPSPEMITPELQTELPSEDTFPLDLEESPPLSDRKPISNKQSSEFLTSDMVDDEFPETKQDFNKSLDDQPEQDKLGQFDDLTENSDFISKDDISTSDFSDNVGNELMSESELLPSESETKESQYSQDQSEGEQEDNQLDEMNIDFL